MTRTRAVDSSTAHLNTATSLSTNTVGNHSTSNRNTTRAVVTPTTHMGTRETRATRTTHRRASEVSWALLPEALEALS